MYPNTNFDSILSDKKTSLILELSTLIKLPVTDIQKNNFDNKTNLGNFKIILYETKFVILEFQFKDNDFYYDLSKIDNSLDNIWFQIYVENQEFFCNKICSLFSLKPDNIQRVSTGKRPNLYLYKKGTFVAPILIECSLENISWTLREVKQHY